MGEIVNFQNMAKKIALAVFDGKKERFIRELSQVEIDNYNINCKILIETNKSTWCFQILEQNYFDFMQLTHEDFENLDKNSSWETVQEKTITANRRLSNFLSSFVSFTDHAKTYLSREYGSESNELKEFKLTASHFFDNNFGYKFFSKLRDYVIHCGMPMVSLDIAIKQNKKIIRLLFDRDDLLSSFTWKAIIKPDLEAQKEFFTVTNLVFETMKCSAQLNEVLKKFETKLITNASKEISKIKELSSECCFLVWEENDSMENANISHIPFHLMT